MLAAGLAALGQDADAPAMGPVPELALDVAAPGKPPSRRALADAQASPASMGVVVSSMSWP
jgi:hypothetical protein